MARERPDSFMPLFVADYLADTTHLSRDQDGAYLNLLMAYWRRGGPLPAIDDQLARIAKATPAEWKRLKPILLPFFSERDGQWHNKRSDEEIAKALARSKAKAEAGQRGAAARWQSDGEAMADAYVRHTAANANAMANTMTKNGSLPLHSQSPNGDMRDSARKARAAKGEHWPSDAVVPEDWLFEAEQKLAEHKRPPLDLRLEAERFANYWANRRDAKGLKTDWKRTWFTWILSDKHDGKTAKTGQSRKSSVLDTLKEIAGDIADLEADRGH